MFQSWCRSTYIRTMVWCRAFFLSSLFVRRFFPRLFASRVCWLSFSLLQACSSIVFGNRSASAFGVSLFPSSTFEFLDSHGLCTSMFLFPTGVGCVGRHLDDYRLLSAASPFEARCSWLTIVSLALMPSNYSSTLKFVFLKAACVSCSMKIVFGTPLSSMFTVFCWTEIM